MSARPNELATINRRATYALIVATMFWAGSFTWAKRGSELVNTAAGHGPNDAFGAFGLIGIRFTVAAILWVLIFPDSRSGWTRASVGRVGGCGLLMGLGLILQNVGLLHTTEAVSAFLTSLSVVWVPILVCVLARKMLHWFIWLTAVLATVGVYLLVGSLPTGFGWGELLSVACSLVFTLHILLVNHASRTDGSRKTTGGQFLVVGLMGLVAASFIDAPGLLASIQAQTSGPLLANMAPLIVISSLGAFGLANHYQPFLAPHKAVVIYLFEPVLAAAFAWAFVPNRAMTGIQIAGAGLILAANLLADLLPARFTGGDATHPTVVPAATGGTT